MTWLRRLTGVLLLAASVAAGLMAWRADQACRAVRGPTSLAVMPDLGVWLAMDDALWQLSAQGKTLGRTPWQALGLPQPPGKLLVQRPFQGPARLLALTGSGTQVRLHGLPQTANSGSSGSLTLRWPGTDQTSQGRWSVALHPDGRIAAARDDDSASQAATLAVFDARGQPVLQARLPALQHPGDVWWDDDTLWVADAHSHALVQLRGKDLTLLRRIDLPAKPPARHTVAGAPHPRHGVDIHAPLATLARREAHADTGRLTHIWADGVEIDQNLGPRAEPRALAWQGETLLAIDGREFRLRRFDLERHPLGDLGDLTLHKALEDGFMQRERWHRHRLAWLGGAAASMLAALAWLLWRPGAGAPAIDTPAQERQANAQAEHWLATNPAWAAAQLPDERVRETLVLRQGRRLRWLVLTNRRLVAFTAHRHGQTLDGSWHRADVASARWLKGDALPWRSRWRAWWAPGISWVSIRTRDGRTLQGWCGCPGVAQRLVAMLGLGATSAAPAPSGAA